MDSMCCIQVLGVLCQDGIVRFIDISTFGHLFDVGCLDDRICSFVIASSGRHIVAVMDSGNINVYNAYSLTRQLNQVMIAVIQVQVAWWYSG